MQEKARVGIIVPRHGKTAVERNLLKRRLRELARTRMLPVVPVLDIVIRAMPGSYRVTFDQLRQEVERIAADIVASGAA